MINYCEKLLYDRYNSFYKLYTDGSKDVAGSGAAIFDPQAEISMKFKIESNINIMHTELIAISECLSYILSLEGDKFVILSDSKSALLHLARLTSNIRGYPIAYDILDSICKINNNNKTVIIQWLPSHVGIMGNEEADTAAKRAISDGIPYDCIPLPNEILIKFKQECVVEWQEYFDERSRVKGIWYKTIVCQLPRCPWFAESKFKRAEIITLLRLRSGHIPSNKFKFMVKRSSTQNCIECGNTQVDDVFHLLMECARNGSKRPRVLKNNYSVGMCNTILAAPLAKDVRSLLKMC
ncbi:uncharacterized protein LOC123864731 [Maniola jurtina]|uniref:uncharacterized protein LOC123864731 n=1 Tax=Maniola jurtina TaxID=191418 RepID=UPI001E6886E2|nr:uncharacterized protein LOC123864731 [Maniola jurtina]